MPCVPKLSIVLIATVLLHSSTASANELPNDNAGDNARIRLLVADLDSDSFTKRDLAQKQLRAIGQPCLSSLYAASSNASGELSKRLRILIPQIEEDFFQSTLLKFSRRKDKDLNVEEGMWLISCISNPGVQRGELTRQLDELAEEVRKRLAGFQPKTAEPKVVVDKIMEVLFEGDDEFYGNITDYENPRNSSLYHVLRRRTGLPILLSHVVVSVANRLDVPIVGIGVPSRYMALYPAHMAPPGTSKDDIIIDAYGGKVLTKDEVKEIIPSFDPAIHLKAAPNRLIVDRMLNNIGVHYFRMNDVRNGQRAWKFREMLQKHAEDPRMFTR